jgi:hypothetical protein
VVISDDHVLDSSYKVSGTAYCSVFKIVLFIYYFHKAVQILGMLFYSELRLKAVGEQFSI